MLRQRSTRKFEVITTTLAILISILIALQVFDGASAQSSKGQATNRPQQQQQQTLNSYGSSNSPAPSPVTQLRQQQQNFRPTATGSQSQKRRQQPKQQQQQTNLDDSSAPVTEDPLSDSEPALYGSVAGAPGVDFPAYTRIPKTSFTCEGKGFDFGFYADEEASCQVYHVCWSGRRESFLCGVGTVFNQAILACDYWHSVDCSKSSQFYGVNSELGKASAEPASGGSQRLQPARSQATLPPLSPAQIGSSSSSSSSSLGSPIAGSSNTQQQVGSNYGEPINQRRQSAQQQPIVQQQQQQQYNTDDSNFDLPQQQVQAPTYKSSDSRQQQPVVTSQPTASNSNNNNFGSSFTPQRNSFNNDYQQRTIQTPANDIPVKTANQQRTPIVQVTTPPPPPPPVKRPRFNMDFNQKVNSLIDSPVRPPIKAANQPQQQQVSKTSPQRPQAQAQTKQPNFVQQQAVNRPQQVAGSQQLSNPSAPFSRKGSSLNNNNNNAFQPQQQQQRIIETPQIQQQQQQQQQQTFDNDEIDEPQQQQQQSFDDSPVQTSTVQTASYQNNQQTGSRLNNQANQLPSFVPQQAIQTTRISMNPADGSSAITSQYDTMSPITSGQNNQNQDQGYGSQQQQQQQQLEDDQSNLSNSNDDFRSAGAKAAASQNQNWYIMRAI